MISGVLAHGVLEVGLRYKVDGKNVAHQEVDGEVIAIDFVSGTYFSMRGTAAEVWQMLCSGTDSSALPALYQPVEGTSGRDLDDEIAAFVTELAAANLIEPVSGQVEAAPQPDGAGRLSPYSPPQLEKFEDMADLIMLDPVHDVSDIGWPYRPGQVA